MHLKGRKIVSNSFTFDTDILITNSRAKGYTLDRKYKYLLSESRIFVLIKTVTVLLSKVINYVLLILKTQIQCARRICKAHINVLILPVLIHVLIFV